MSFKQQSKLIKALVTVECLHVCYQMRPRRIRTYHQNGMLAILVNINKSVKVPNAKYKRTDALSLWYQQQSTTVDTHGPLHTRGEIYQVPGGASIPCPASRNRHERPRHNESARSLIIKTTPYNRIEHSDRIHHISDTIYTTKRIGSQNYGEMARNKFWFYIW